MFLQAWQHSIIESVDANDRSVLNILICPNTNVMHHIRSMCDKGFGIDLTECDPSLIVDSFFRVMSMRSIRDPRCVFLNMPTEHADTCTLFAAIDKLREGRMSHSKFAHSTFWFFAPQIWIISDTEPDVWLRESRAFKVYRLNRVSGMF